MRLIDADVLEPDTDYDDGEYWAVSMAQIQNAPTIEERKTGKWIPCSERMPEESGRYIITAYDGVSRRTATAVFQKRLGGWCLSGRMAYWRVVAWMPFPEPYQEGNND